MKAAIFYGAEVLRIEEVPIPKPGPRDVLIRMSACGICGGDYRMYHSASAAEPTIPGHELVGQVVEIGAEVQRLSIGDRVAVSPNQPCGTCATCVREMPHLCNKQPRRTAATGGGFSEYCLVSQEQCHLLPVGLTELDAVTSEPLACCIHAIGRVRVRPGDRVVVVGAGANAQLFAQLVRLQDASWVGVADSIDSRLDVARDLGADTTLDPDAINTAEGPLKGGADVVIVTRGAPEWTTRAIGWCGPGARILCYGVAPAAAAASVEPRLLWHREISLVDSRSYAGTFGAAVSLLASGQVRVGPMMKPMVPLEDLPRALDADPRDFIKAVVVPTSGGE